MNIANHPLQQAGRLTGFANSIVDRIAFGVAVTIARHNALHHAREWVVREEGAGVQVGVAGAEVQQAVRVGLLIGEYKIMLSF